MAFEPVLTRNVGNPDALTLRGYKKTGGYEALAKALKMEPPSLAQGGLAFILAYTIAYAFFSV